MSIENDYVVLDVETNGLSSLRDDLLSISIYKPDDGKIYDRFLPLELAKEVYTTHINGITKEKLKGATPLTQDEVDEMIQTFELDKRIILTYGSFDEKFIKNYFKRKNIYGFEKMSFYNYKKNIISSRFSGGNVTKDNMCRLFGIKNIQKIHTGTNDCRLEWELFKKLDGKNYLITNDNVFEMNSDYIVPVSYLSSHHNLKSYVGNLPNILFEQQIIKEYQINGKNFKKFPTNFNGMTIEHLINTMLRVNKIDSRPFLYENKSKLKYIGTLPPAYDIVPMSFNPDGTVTAIREQDKLMENELNNFIQALKNEMQPLIQFIAKDIFGGQNILSQELVVNPQNNILALCDLSTPDTVMEIKAYTMNIYNIKDQLYYEANGRNCYLLQIDWSHIPEGLTFIISKITFSIGFSKRGASLENRWKKFQNKIKNENIVVTNYVNSATKVKLQCKLCNHEWEASCATIVKNPQCPFCNPPVKHSTRKVTKISEEEKNRLKETKYNHKLTEASAGKLKAYNYTGSKEYVNVECTVCGHRWRTRADHLLGKAYCPRCKKKSCRKE